MIVAIDAAGKASLNEADNFRGFKVVSSLADKAKLGDALKVAGRYDGEHAWIAKAWLIAQAPKDPNWTTEFDKMVRSRDPRAGSKATRSARMLRLRPPEPPKNRDHRRRARH